MNFGMVYLGWQIFFGAWATCSQFLFGLTLEFWLQQECEDVVELCKIFPPLGY